jgi:PPOX class probable F420-dependent enzyme
VIGAETVDDVAIPASHLDLFIGTACAVLTTLGPRGEPRSSLVWVDAMDGCARVNTTLDRQKCRDILTDPRVSLLVVDPDDTARFIQIRGTATVTTERALAHLDGLTRKYTEHPSYYGHVYPAERGGIETRVIVIIHARRIMLDAVHR